MDVIQKGICGFHEPYFFKDRDASTTPILPNGGAAYPCCRGFFVFKDGERGNPMALRDQPYLPLYIQDYLTDEKLNECLPASQGVYVKIMCLMHKSKEYGCILLEQKHKQSDKQVENFALKLVNHLTFSKEVLLSALEDLLENNVLRIDGDRLEQKRMIKDNYISVERSKAGKMGGNKGSFAKAKGKAKGKAKTQANSEYENEYENEGDIKPDVLQFTDHAIKSIHENMGNLAPKPTPENLSKSADTIDKLIRLDGFNLDYIKKVVEWAMNDDFWKKNVLSLASLRNKGKNQLTKFQNMANSFENGQRPGIPKRTENNIRAAQQFIEKMSKGESNG